MDNKKVNTMDPLSAAISAGSSFLGSVVNGLFTRHQNKENRKQTNYWNERQLEFNSEEAFKQRTFEADQARRTREFNASEAEKQRIFNEAMWRKENSYNTPSAQLARLRDAGFNPNLFGGDNTAGSVASSAPASASAPQGASASAGSLSAYQGVPIQVNNPLMDASIIRLNNAQADKMEADANKTREMLPYDIDTAKGNLRVMDSNVKVNEENAKLLHQKTEETFKNCSLLDEKIKESQLYQDILDKDGKIKQKELDNWDERFKKEMRALDDKHLLDAKELAVMASQIKKNLADAANAYAQGEAAKARAALDGVQYKIQNEYGMATAKLTYDTAKQQYDLTVDDVKLKRTNIARKQKIADKRADEDFYSDYGLINDALDVLEATSEAVGISAGINLSTKVK